jgi:hypothetical protein
LPCQNLFSPCQDLHQMNAAAQLGIYYINDV